MWNSIFESFLSELVREQIGFIDEGFSFVDITKWPWARDKAMPGDVQEHDVSHLRAIALRNALWSFMQLLISGLGKIKCLCYYNGILSFFFSSSCPYFIWPCMKKSTILYFGEAFHMTIGHPVYFLPYIKPTKASLITE